MEGSVERREEGNGEETGTGALLSASPRAPAAGMRGWKPRRAHGAGGERQAGMRATVGGPARPFAHQRAVT